MIVRRAQVRPRREIGVRLDGVEDVFRRLAVVHPTPHLVDEHAEIARRLRQHGANGGGAVDDEPVARKEPLGVVTRHRFQRVGPVLGVPLHLLRVPAVRRLPDDQVAGEQVPSLRHPDPERVVGLAARRRVLERDVAETLRQPIAHEERRRIEALREHRLRQRELPLVDARVPPVHEPIAVEARRTGFLRDDRGRIAGIEEGAEPERVVDVPVRVDGDPQRRVAPPPHELLHAARRVREARIDEHQPVARAERIGVDERAVHEDVGRDLGRLAEELEPRVRRIRRDEWMRRHDPGLYPLAAGAGKP